MERMESPASLNELPLPYDISAAVQEALCLNASPEAAGVHDLADSAKCSVKYSGIERENRVRADKKPVQTTEEAFDKLIPELTAKDVLEDVFDSLSIPPMDTDAWAAENEEQGSNMEDLERFCRYIDGDEEAESDRSGQTSPVLDKYRPKTVPCLGSPVKPVRSSATRCVRQIAMPPAPVANYTPWSLELANKELWHQFNGIGTEMVITKNGRRMFPTLVVSVSGMNPEGLYTVHLDILPADDRRYKFVQTDWIAVGKAEKRFTYGEYVHPESPNAGRHWMNKAISFKLLKLTNNKHTTYHDQIILNSMQKYQPAIRITSCESDSSQQISHSFQFPETSFIAVTAYQNSRITQLKIDNNPYARAFRESVPSESGMDRKGGHFRPKSTSSMSNTPSPKHRPRFSVPPPHLSNPGGSATSVESGFESSDSSELLLPQVNFIATIPNHLSPPQNPYGGCSSLNYWADENTLYHSALIYPPPLLDPSVSFSEPYLTRTSRMVLESSEVVVSPIKPLFHPQPEEYSSHALDTVYDDDDVFV